MRSLHVMIIESAAAELHAVRETGMISTRREGNVYGS
jgi:hypothetical protein